MNVSLKHQVLVVGGGFGGVKAALELCKNSHVSVTLLSDQPDFRYYPALYHTATGGTHVQTSIPLAKILDTQRVTIVHGSAKTLDRQAHTLTTEDGQVLKYDTLILALGVVTNFFGIKGLEEFSYGIKSWEQIRRFKQHVHEQLEAGEPELHYVIVGAGPTGIELAGALPSYLKAIMKKHGISGKPFKISIIEAAPRLLPHSSEKISHAVERRLAKLGIELQLGQTVEGQTADQLMVSGKPINSRTVVWTAGTANNPFFKTNNFALNDRGKVVVNERLLAEENIYVIGDNAATPYSGMAQAALRDGIFAAKDLGRTLAGKPTPAYQQHKPITVIPVGEGWAAVDWGNVSFAGFIGGLLRQAADWVGFHDVEPWWKASKQWMTEFKREEDCPTCNK